MEKKVIPFGSAMGMKVAFSTAVSVDVRSVDKIIWVSGQVSFDEKGNILGKDDMYVQTEHVILNIQSALAEFGAGLDDVVEVNVFVRDMSRLKEIHEARLKYFKEPFPTSTLVEVNKFVHPDALIEINAVAVI
ncbi:MAG: putative aminoacrylate peracid reductase RutC [Synergistetes bacterium ADurb.Bin155]|jgi:enamine deaminase RidA (YjgF/YER057c/UK114 family)|nr:RidA family protein [Synergistales bacterium]NMD16982.1 RidA family protein [Synergistaceae bacterium]OQB46763.1 MAG: putative aminoacrylate peracid reductase RutC [Synergistetes bacterium ADurb.Bin155]MBP8995593.1 RidA family protein [Synergistales bacterium]HOC81609.1 RidA family protein [Synergistales bacterium]